MTLHLPLSPELEQRLLQVADRCGQPCEAVAMALLERHLPTPAQERRAAAVALLQGWMQEDALLTPEETQANAAVLFQLDEDRPSYRKLFADLPKDDLK